MIDDHRGGAPGEQLCWSKPWMRFSARTVCRAVPGARGNLRDSVQIVGAVVPYLVGAAAALAEGDRGVLTPHDT
jgi:hypothetical protein